MGHVWCVLDKRPICSSTSRLIIHESIAERVLKQLVEETKKIYLGDPFSDNNPSMGPLVSKKQQESVLGYIDSARKEGAKVIVGGKKGRTGWILCSTNYHH